MDEFVLGIDTSNYTTSAALVQNGRVVLNVKRPVKVKSGARGIRQSDAVFSHVQNLPEVMNAIGARNICAVGVSVRPRDTEGSYMPCFLAGQAAAAAIAATGGLPLYAFSHQRGHLMAALYGAGRTELYGKELLAFHVSGGTTELLHVEGERIEKVGGTLDLNAGQVIDRIGVKLGLKFPCGAALESLSLPFSETECWSHVRNMECNLSGLENKAADLLQRGRTPSEVAAFTLKSIARTLDRMTEQALEHYGKLPVIYAGGVMSNAMIRRVLEERFDGYFAPSEFSCDNAAGIALLAADAYARKRADR